MNSEGLYGMNRFVFLEKEKLSFLLIHQYYSILQIVLIISKKASTSLQDPIEYVKN